MIRTLLLNASATLADRVGTIDGFEIRVGRHGQSPRRPTDTPGDPTAFSVVFHLCVTGSQSGNHVASYGPDGRPVNIPVASQEFLSTFAEHGGFSVYFVDYFNHEIAGHPDFCQLGSLDHGDSAELRVNPAIAQQPLQLFASTFGKYFADNYLRITRKIDAKVLVARSNRHPLMLLHDSNNLLLPAPQNISILPDMVKFIAENLLPALAPQLSARFEKSPRLLRLEAAMTEELVRHHETVAELQAEMEMERQLIKEVNEVAYLNGEPLITCAIRLLSQFFGVTALDVTSVVGVPAMFMREGSVAMFAVGNGSVPTIADFGTASDAVSKLRRHNIEPATVVILYNTTGSTRHGEMPGVSDRVLTEYAYQTGMHPVTGRELANLVNGARAKLVNTADLVRYLGSDHTPVKGSHSPRRAA